MKSCEILIIGGGVAGLSLGAHVASSGKTIVLEREDFLGVHSSGRSVTKLHFGIGGECVRRLTRASIAEIDERHGVDEAPFGERTPVLFIGTKEMASSMDSLERDLRLWSPDAHRVLNGDILKINPYLRVDEGAVTDAIFDPEARKIDANRMLQAYARMIRSMGGDVSKAEEVLKITREKSAWLVETKTETYQARIIVNAAGAWAGRVAEMAGLSTLGLIPKIRTVVAIPVEMDEATPAPPYTRTVDDFCYMMPEHAQMLVSPMDTEDSEPCDAQPDEYFIALAAHRMEVLTRFEARRISAKWAGLRTYAPDGLPVVGYDENAGGFFWLAGQAGFGLQTAPALSRLAASVLLGEAPPADIVDIERDIQSLAPGRFQPQDR